MKKKKDKMKKKQVGSGLLGGGGGEQWLKRLLPFLLRQGELARPARASEERDFVNFRTLRGSRSPIEYPRGNIVRDGRKSKVGMMRKKKIEYFKLGNGEEIKGGKLKEKKNKQKERYRKR